MLLQDVTACTELPNLKKKKKHIRELFVLLVAGRMTDGHLTNRHLTNAHLANWTFTDKHLVERIFHLFINKPFFFIFLKYFIFIIIPICLL